MAAASPHRNLSSRSNIKGKEDLREHMTKPLILSALCLSVALSTLSAQTTLTNPDLVKLSKAGLSEDFILNLIDQQGSRLQTEPSALVQLKNEGVNERIIS